MPKLQYVGSENIWQEFSTTGLFSVWRAGQIEDRNQSEAALLLGTGNFIVVDKRETVPARNLVSLPSGTQRLKHLGFAGSSVASAFTYTTAWTVEGEYNAVRFEYSNYGGGTYAITAAKTAPAPTLAHDGVGLTYSNVTFDNAAGSKLGDTWNGTAGSVTTYNVPAAISGSGAQVVPGVIYSDWIRQRPVASTQSGAEDLRIIQHRVYSASTSYSIINTGSGASNWGNYNTFSRRKVFGLLTAGDQVSTITSQTPSTNWTWMMCTGVQAMLIKPVYNHAVFGDSISRGQGAFDTNYGLWGWSQQATQGLTDDGLGTHSLVNYACSGQQKAATWNTFLNVIAQGGLHTAIMLPWSPNDGESNVELFRFHVSAFVSECRKYGVKPILATQPPATTIVTNGFDIARKKINSEIRSFSYMGIPVADFDEVTSDQGAPARFISGLGRDGVHPSDLGHAAMAAEYKRALLEALSL